MACDILMVVLKVALFIALVAMGYGYWKLCNFILGRFGRWLQAKNLHKDWSAIPGIMLLFIGFTIYYIAFDILLGINIYELIPFLNE